MEKKVIVEAKHMNKRFGSTIALNHVRITVCRGEILGLIVEFQAGYDMAKYYLDQGYWIATSAEQFNQYYAVDSSIESPAYTAEMLEGLLGSDYATFADFVSKYSFEDISAMK